MTCLVVKFKLAERTQVTFITAMEKLGFELRYLNFCSYRSSFLAISHYICLFLTCFEKILTNVNLVAAVVYFQDEK